MQTNISDSPDILKKEGHSLYQAIVTDILLKPFTDTIYQKKKKEIMYLSLLSYENEQQFKYVLFTCLKG
jgi:hypothetical protein